MNKFFFIEEYLSEKEFIILLFINIVKGKEIASNTIHTDQSTYIEPLTTKKPSEALRLFLMCTNWIKFQNHLKMYFLLKYIY